VNFKNFLSELKRRNVIKAGVSYAVFSWLLIQVASILYPSFGWGQDAISKTLIVLIIGFPLWIIFAYVFEWTTSGFKKTDDVAKETSISSTTSKKMNGVIIAGLSLAVLLLVADRIFDFSGINDATNTNKSIAVMAFADMSPEKDQEYFSDGISEEILNLLAQITDLKVISRNSSFSFKNKEVTANEIGDALNVKHVLEGSIRKSGNTFRITTQLIDATNSSQLWSETYDRPMDDIFKIQDEIAANVSEQLQIKILGKQKVNNSPDVEAYNLYLKAHHLSNQNTKTTYLSAEKIIKEALEIDSTYSDAWRTLANIYNTGMYNFSIRSYEEGIPLALEAAQKAVELDPNTGSNYIALSSLQELNWDFEASAKNSEKALEIDPYNAIIIGTVANMTFGNIEKSVELLKRSIELDPLVYVNFYNLGFAYYKLGEIEKSEEAFETFKTYYPNSQILHYMMAQIRIAQGRNDEALIEIEQETHEFFSLYGLNFVHYALGNKKRADELLDKFIEKYGESDPSNLADLYAFRGNKDESFKYLNKALEIKDPVLMEALAYPSFKSMRDDPRWLEFINNLNLPEDHGFLKQ